LKQESLILKPLQIVKTDRDKLLVFVFVITLLTSITLYPCLKNDFINWDDDIYVYQNPNIQQTSWANVKTFFSSFYFANYAPFTLMSYAFDYQIGRLKPLTYHTTNLLLHLFNCILVFCLVYLLSRTAPAAFLVAILFGIHPLHVESVAWVSARKDLLYSLFFLSSLISYVKYLHNKKALYYVLSLLLFLASCLSKAMAITLPFVLLLIEYLLRQKIDKKRLFEKIPFLLISFAFGVITILTQYGLSHARPAHLFSFLNNVLRASYGLVFYMCKIILPVRLSGLYPNPQNIGSNYPMAFLLAPFVIILLILLIIKFGKNRKIIFGTGFFIITIFPVLQLLPIGIAIAADRYTYIPALGVFYLFGEGCSWFYKEKLTGKKHIRMVFIACLIVIVTTLSLLSWQRCNIWKDSITFWTDVINKYPNTAVAYNNRASAYEINGDDKKAIEELKKALSLDPNYLKALDSLLRTYCKLGMKNVAILIYLDINQIRTAINLYQTLLTVIPQNTLQYMNGEIFNGLAIAHYRKKEYGYAEYYATKAVNTGYKIDPEIQTFLKTKGR
jgi:tetratricopeptide (TPR) repeat protein